MSKYLNNSHLSGRKLHNRITFNMRRCKNPCSSYTGAEAASSSLPRFPFATKLPHLAFTWRNSDAIITINSSYPPVQIGKEEMESFLSADNVSVTVGNANWNCTYIHTDVPGNAHTHTHMCTNTSELMSESSKMTGYEIYTQRSIASLSINSKHI